MTVERCFADTNLFLRYLTNDVPAQADQVDKLLRRAGSGELVLVTSAMVIAEIVWTMESFYELPREEIQASVFAILNTPGLEVESKDLILQAIVWYTENKVDFIDAYNAAWLLAEEMRIAYNFDRKHFARLKRIVTRVPGENSKSA